jgi:hypothetical protein
MCIAVKSSVASVPPDSVREKHGERSDWKVCVQVSSIYWFPRGWGAALNVGPDLNRISLDIASTCHRTCILLRRLPCEEFAEVLVCHFKHVNRLDDVTDLRLGSYSPDPRCSTTNHPRHVAWQVDD